MVLYHLLRLLVGQLKNDGSMVKRLRHRPFTAVTRVRFPLESLVERPAVMIYGAVAKW